MLKLKRIWLIFKNYQETFFSSRRMTDLEIMLFFRQFATLINAGIPLLQSLTLLEKCQAKLQWFILTLKQRVLAGTPLHKSIKNIYFSPDEFTLHLIKIGEHTGKLGEMLEVIALTKEKKLFLRKKILRILSYPLVIITVACLVTLTMFIFIIPRFTELYQNAAQPLPFMTRLIFSFSYYLNHQKTLLIFLLSAIVLSGIWFCKRVGLLKIAIHIPYLKTLMHKTFLAQFSRHLAITFSAGIALPEALMLITLPYYELAFNTRMQRISQKLYAGFQLHQTLESLPGFPDLLIQMVKIGEKTGMLEKMLHKAADLFESDIDQLTERMSQFLEPLIMLVLGVLIGGLVIGMYLPIFQLGNSL